jgi:predicted phage tail protein
MRFGGVAMAVLLAASAVVAPPTVHAQQVPLARWTPSGLVATPGDGEVTLSWDDPADDRIAGWQYQMRRVGGDWSKTTPIAQIDSSSDSTISYTVSGLDNGKTYQFRISAVNAAGTKQSKWSDPVKATPKGVPIAKWTPSGLVATPGDGEVTLSWDDPADDRIAGWQYQMRRVGGDWSKTTPIAQIDSSSDSTISYTVSGLDNGMSYEFRVSAVNAAGKSSDWSKAGATLSATIPPPKPADLSAKVEEGEVKLVWAKPARSGRPTSSGSARSTPPGPSRASGRIRSRPPPRGCR